MNIEIKKSIKPVNYFDAINILESRLKDLYENNEQELIWTLEHNEVFTAGTSYKESEIIDKSIKILETNRGGKITCHGPGQLICYFVLDLRKKKDIRKFITNSFNEMHPADAADIIEHLSEGDRESLIKLNNFNIDPEIGRAHV